MRQHRRSYREPEDDGAPGDDLASVHQRLDDLTRQLERMAQANAPRGNREPAPDRVADALSRLDRRLDQVIQEGRAAAQDFDRVRHVMPRQVAAPPQPAPSRGPAHWAAQISARQRALDGGAAAPVAAAPVAPAMQAASRVPAPDYSGLEHQLREINHQISSLHQPYENALDALRDDLAEIGRTLTDAMPRRAVEALEAEVRTLSEQFEHSRQAGAAAGNPAANLSAIERELAEVRHSLQHLTPAESLVGFEDAIRGLYDRLDQIAGSGPAPVDSPAVKQLEQAVDSLHGVVAHIASDSTLEQLAAEVRGLATKIERVQAESSTDALGKLEARIGALMESGRAVPPDLELSIRSLSERLDRMQLSQGDQLALGALEDRIAKLAEKLDASDAKLSHLDAIERGLADLLVHLESTRNKEARGVRAPLPPEPAEERAAPSWAEPAAFAAAPAPPVPEPVRAEPPVNSRSAQRLLEPQQFEAPPIQPLPAAPELAPLAPRSAPIDVEPLPPPASARQMPTRSPQRPIDPNLPPDTPLEPGSGVPRVKPGSVAARIAASEAALGVARPAPAEIGGKSAAIAAARNAVKASYLDTPVKVSKSQGRGRRSWFKLPFRKAADAAIPGPALPPAPNLAPPPSLDAPTMPTPAAAARPSMPKPVAYEADAASPSRGRRVMKVVKTLLIAASVVIIVVGTVQTAIEFLFPHDASISSAPAAKDQSKSPAEAKMAPTPKGEAPATTPVRPMPAPQGALPMPPVTDPATTNSIGNQSLFDPTTAVKLPSPDVTGAIPHKPAPTKPATGTPVSELPASISPALRTAALANDPAAAYELGARYAEGRSVPQSWSDAARWFQKAADAGFAPAQFRLASLTEKGEGVTKDVQAARRLYIAAAEKGHAKAMHNLAVLYAEGIDGKPDYKAAASWFLKAATYGVTDSQFNLAILYARGIGMQSNLAESYRWFAMAAANGDADAARKRDEVAARLDARTLAAAKLAVQSFVAEREPDEATNLRAPPGGWDHAPAQPAKPRRQVSATRAPTTAATPAR